MTDLTQARLKEVLRYDPDNGSFIWIAPSKYNRRLIGCVAGCLDNHGYITIFVDERCYFAHRLAWLYVTGEWPDDMMDHANMQRADNRWCNLRAATRTQNNANRKSTNAAGLKGAYFSDRRPNKKWQAAIGVNGRNKSLGYYHTAEEAHAAYCRAAVELYGTYARSA